MKIESKRLDEKVPLIEPSAREIAAFILQGRPEMLEVFSDVVIYQNICQNKEIDRERK